jgi:hypothetical protein
VLAELLVFGSEKLLQETHTGYGYMALLHSMYFASAMLKAITSGHTVQVVLLS